VGYHRDSLKLVEGLVSDVGKWFSSSTVGSVGSTVASMRDRLRRELHSMCRRKNMLIYYYKLLDLFNILFRVW
jgi:hypothetical protein